MVEARQMKRLWKEQAEREERRNAYTEMERARATVYLCVWLSGKEAEIEGLNGRREMEMGESEREAEK